MKNKIYVLVITVALAMSLCACGKKSNSVADNLINDNPDQINFEDITIPEGVSENVIANIEQIAQNYGSDSLSENEQDESSSDEANNEASDDASSEVNEDDNASEDDVNANEDNGDDQSEPSEQVAIMNNTEVADAVTVNSSLNIANLSGVNLKKLCITFNTGTFVDNDILQGQRLKDGETFNFIVLDTDSLRSTTDLIISITGYDRGDNKIEFGDLRIIDPTNMNINLSKDSNGYMMYIE